MKFQRSSFKCGVYALMNALRVFGIKISEKKILKHTATTRSEGTNEHGIKNAIERFDYGWTEISCTNRIDAWFELNTCLDDGRPVIICVDDAQHWVTVIGKIGDKVILFDSDSSTASNRAESGICVYGEQELFTRWNKINDIYYGIELEA